MFLKGYGKQRLTQKYGADLAMQQQSRVGAGYCRLKRYLWAGRESSSKTT
jgi:hypothetical protein